MPPKAKPDPEPTPVVASDPDGATITPPDLDAPTTPNEAPEAPEADDQKPVTMADVAALNGIGAAPDRSDARTVKRSEVAFISAGMASDLEQQGWTIDPATGRKIVRDED